MYGVELQKENRAKEENRHGGKNKGDEEGKGSLRIKWYSKETLKNKKERRDNENSHSQVSSSSNSGV